MAREISFGSMFRRPLPSMPLKVIPRNSWPIGINLLLSFMAVAHFVLIMHPFLFDLLDLEAVGGLLETVLMTVFFEAQGVAVAFEEEDFPMAHFES